MWTATLFVVFISGPIELTDTRGPYQTEQECRDRIEEMKQFSLTLRPVIKFGDGKCVKNGLADGELSV